MLLQFVKVLACGQKANESLEFLKSHRRVGPLAEITALVLGKTYTPVVPIKQNFSLVEFDRNASLAVNGVEFSSIMLEKL